MSHFNPSAPPLPTTNSVTITTQYVPVPSNYNHIYTQTTPNYPPQTPHPPPHMTHQSYGPPNPGPFPPGTDPEVIRSFQMVDRDNSGFIEDFELQNALSFGYKRFNLSTVRLLMFLFKNPFEKSLKIGPGEFAALWSCLGQWRAIFERFDRDRSGKIDVDELREALYSLGYAVPPSVLQLLIARYDCGRGQKAQLDFDRFVECGMVVKGLTEKFKEKDSRYTGSATLSYDDFMSMVLPYLVTYN